MESLDSPIPDPAPEMQAAPSQHSNFGQPVVSANSTGQERLLTPSQAATLFHLPEYLLRKACAEARLEHLRVVNSLWLAPAAVAAFARALRAKNGRP